MSSIIARPAPIRQPNRKRLRLRMRPSPTAVLPDGRVVSTALPDGTPIDQFAPARFSAAAIEPPAIDAPEPVPSDLDAGEPWYASAPWDEDLDGFRWCLSHAGGGSGLPMTDADLLPSIRRASAMSLDASEDSERFA